MSMASKSVISFYERNAQNFDNERNRDLFEKAWLEKFLSFVPKGGFILDLGCGCGQPITEYFIEQGYNVTGVDSSAKLIEMCKSRFPNQEWIIEDMRQVSFNKYFDGILAWDSFFHLTHEDQESMFHIFSSCAKSDAPVMFTAGPEHGEATNTLWDAPLYHASFSKDEYCNLLIQNNFSDISYKLEDHQCGGRSVYLARHNRSKE